jgi:chromate transporter
LVSTPADPIEGRSVGCGALFLGFLIVGLRGFGGVLPWARRMVVEERRWMNEGEFLEILSLGQLLPGPNIANVAVALGARFQGVRGSIAAFTGLMVAPLAIVLSLGALYERYGSLPLFGPVFANLGAAAAGLVLGMGLKMGRSETAKPLSILVAGIAFIAVALLHWDLVVVVLVLVPVSIGLHWAFRR